jgi:hypothetical protein
METEIKIKRLWFENDRIYVETEDNRALWQSLLWYPRLQAATDEQRNKYYFTWEGIHWREIDEDISFESFFYDNPEPTGIAKMFLQHPEIKPSAIADKAGIPQNLFTTYIAGTKKTSPETVKLIQETLHDLAKELAIIQIPQMEQVL